MAYLITLRKKGEEIQYSGIRYVEEDLIKLLISIREGFCVFEGAIIDGYSSISMLRILERNWDDIDTEGRPAQFFPFTGDHQDDYRNHAGTLQPYDEHGGMFEEPMEFDVSEEYIRRYILSDEKPYAINSCKYDITKSTLRIDSTSIVFKKYSDNACILEHLFGNIKGTHCFFGDITDSKIGNDSLGSEKSFYSARRHINKRIYEKIPIKEFIGVMHKALYSDYLGRNS